MAPHIKQSGGNRPFSVRKAALPCQGGKTSRLKTGRIRIPRWQPLGMLQN